MDITSYNYLVKIFRKNNPGFLFEIATRPVIVSSFKDLFKLAPESLQEFMLSMWGVSQDPQKHPEGNTLKHIISTVNRTIRAAKNKAKETGEPFDINLVLTAFFHDLGKRDAPSILDHMKISQGIMKDYKDFVLDMGGDPELIDFVIEYHHHIKPHNWDNPDGKSKFPVAQDVKDKVSSHRGYKTLQDFETHDISGLYTSSQLKQDITEEIKHLVFQKLNEKHYF